MRWVVVLCVLAGCKRVQSSPGEPDAPTSLTVTIDRRSAVRDPASLLITVDGALSSSVDSIRVAGASFPVTYTLDVSERTGPFQISVDAVASSGELVGRGTATTSLDAWTARVMLHGADFVVNTTYAGNQFVSDDAESGGMQVAGSVNGDWLVAFRDSCESCVIHARRFDVVGQPIIWQSSGIGDQLAISTMPTTPSAVPAVATVGSRTVVVWDYTDPVSAERGIACRAFDVSGPLPGQPRIALEPADAVSATALVSGNFLLTWRNRDANDTVTIRAAIVDWTCAVIVSPYKVSTIPSTSWSRRSHAASNGDRVMYSWVVDGDVYLRDGIDSGTLVGTQGTAIRNTPTSRLEHVRVSRWVTGFAVVARRAAWNVQVEGQLELYRISADGLIDLKPIIVDDRTGSDSRSNQAFGIAARDDGTLMVVWHVCSSAPDSCDVYARIVRSDGTFAGDKFLVPTNTVGDQMLPSVTVVENVFAITWTDASGAYPDASGTSVRARIIDPDL